LSAQIFLGVTLESSQGVRFPAELIKNLGKPMRSIAVLIAAVAWTLSATSALN
jgi:hypothetical protein